MPPKREGRGRREAVELEGRIDQIERILEGLVQVVQDAHNNNHNNAPEQPAMPMPGAEIIHRKMIVMEYNAKFMELSRYAPYIVSMESRKARRFKAGLRWIIKNKVDILRLSTHQEVLQRAIIAERALNESAQYRENNKKRSGGSTSRGQSSKRQSLRSSSGNLSTPHGNIISQRSSRPNELPTCLTCQKKHWGECHLGSRSCYRYGQEGHQIRDCSMSRIQGAGTSAPASVQQPPAGRKNNQPQQG
ncbi:hypothetical protein Acr_00g0074740 [Actinidia rufa]|uniref:CCHC-type domain-containing protein n=1 Tax=Actinidia rufa TaxID=165716 RepID=A0A7J0DSK8_9ERIC|nr:hypothetical protein Acr_00g0074740 [Actinidia rufa]